MGILGSAGELESEKKKLHKPLSSYEDPIRILTSPKTALPGCRKKIHNIISDSGLSNIDPEEGVIQQ